MPVEVILPKVDMDMTSGTISKWLVRAGDRVTKGAGLFEMETDKAAMEIEATSDGIIGNILAAEGATVAVGSVVAWIYQAGEAMGETAALKVQKPSVESSPAHPPQQAAIIQDLQRFRATPKARHLARRAGISLLGISGTGPGGRISAANVEALVQAVSGGDKPALTFLQRGTASRVMLTGQAASQFQLSVTCNPANLLQLREALNARAPRDKENNPVWRLSINDFIIKALAASLQQVPAANGTWADDFMEMHNHVDVGLAVAVAGGLFSPVIKAAEAKSLSQISTEVKDLVRRARQNALTPAECCGGTTTVSNLGMYGIEEFSATTSPPQATMLAIGAATGNFMALEGQRHPQMQMKCSLTCDHRMVDGATGAELLKAFQAFIGDPALMLL